MRSEMGSRRREASENWRVGVYGGGGDLATDLEGEQALVDLGALHACLPVGTARVGAALVTCDTHQRLDTSLTASHCVKVTPH